jgi:pentatricopeptide repeat protein
MTSCGLKPDVITYNALISACDKGLRPEQAQATFNDLVESGLEPDGISYCSLISAFASVGDAESARKVRFTQYSRGRARQELSSF